MTTPKTTTQCSNSTKRRHRSRSGGACGAPVNQLNMSDIVKLKTTKLGELGNKRETPMVPLPVVLRDGALVCNECGGLMTPVGEVTSTLVAKTRIGNNHFHDDNCLRQMYVCPRKHTRAICKRQRCEKCGWRGEESCWCHAGLKVDEWPVAPKETT